ncbi:MAG: lipoyl(octanoyl) transferase LipB [Bacteroidota bacterium]
MHRTVNFQDLGVASYEEAWSYQQSLLDAVIARKRQNRGLQPTDADYQTPIHHLLFCEHPPVYTLGRKGKIEHLLLDEKELQSEGIEFYKINRGGDITYHGPGQLVAYPIFDLEDFFTDVHRYVRTLEEVVIQTLAQYEIQGHREEGYTGVWLSATDMQPKRKICAIGVHLSRWVSMHGFAFNISPNLRHFEHIIPCGIQEDDKAVTSLEKELGRAVDMDDIKKVVKQQFAELFEFNYQTTTYPNKQ